MAFKPVKETNKTKGDEGKVISMSEEKSLFETMGIMKKEKDYYIQSLKKKPQQKIFMLESTEICGWNI